MSSETPEPEPVRNPQVSTLATKIVLGWTPATPEEERIVAFSWGGKDFSSLVGRIRFDGELMNVAWDAEDGFLRHIDGKDHRKLFEQPFEGRLDSGATFAADVGLFRSNSLVEGHYWTVRHSEGPSVLWVAEVEGVRGLGGATADNLAIVARTNASDGSWRAVARNGHRFHGTYTYYLVPGSDEGRWFLIIDSGSAPPVRDELNADVLALQFVLGTSFSFDVLCGLDEGGNAVAFLGGRYGRRDGRRSEDVVPRWLIQEHWPSAFLAAISTAYRKRPELRLYIALSFYLDSLAGHHVEGRYLDLHVALEALAFWFLRAEGIEEPPLVVKDKWKPWLKENKATIRSLATAGLEDALYSKVTSLPKRSSGRVVEAAFKHFGLTISPEMSKELAGRNDIVHTAIMFSDRPEDVEEYRERIAIVRTMLVALLARIVGYDGAILGWTREPRRPYNEADASWWTVTDSTREVALVRYLIESEAAADSNETGAASAH